VQLLHTIQVHIAVRGFLVGFDVRAFTNCRVFKVLDQAGLDLVLFIAMPEPPERTTPPSVYFACCQDCDTVLLTGRDSSDGALHEKLDLSWCGLV